MTRAHLACAMGAKGATVMFVTTVLSAHSAGCGLLVEAALPGDRETSIAPIDGGGPVGADGGPGGSGDGGTADGGDGPKAGDAEVAPTDGKVIVELTSDVGCNDIDGVWVRLGTREENRPPSIGILSDGARAQCKTELLGPTAVSVLTTFTLEPSAFTSVPNLVRVSVALKGAVIFGFPLSKGCSTTDSEDCMLVEQAVAFVPNRGTKERIAVDRQCLAGQCLAPPSCAAATTDSNGTLPGGVCVSTAVEKTACEGATTDSNGALKGGKCANYKDGVAACDTGYTDSNGSASGGRCVSNKDGKADCDSGYVDSNGALSGGSCVQPGQSG